MNRRILFNRKLYAALRRIETEYHDLICMEDEETIHDLRVSIRRATPLLDMYAKGVKSNKKSKALKKINNKLKAHFKALNSIRDMQVMIERLVEMHPSSLAVLDKMDADIKSQHRDILIKVSGWNIPELIDEVMVIVLECPDERLKLRKHINDLVRENKKDVLKHLKKKKRKASDLHRLRISLKKYRYALEMSESLDMKRSISAGVIKAYQDELGYFQDVTILLKYLEDTTPDLPILDEVKALHDDTRKTLINETKDWSFLFNS